MGRSRGSVTGGYVRKTVSLPGSLYERVEEYFQQHEGATLSAISTTALEDFLAKSTKRKTR